VKSKQLSKREPGLYTGTGSTMDIHFQLFLQPKTNHTYPIPDMNNTLTTR